MRLGADIGLRCETLRAPHPAGAQQSSSGGSRRSCRARCRSIRRRREPLSAAHAPADVAALARSPRRSTRPRVRPPWHAVAACWPLASRRSGATATSCCCGWPRPSARPPRTRSGTASSSWSSSRSHSSTQLSMAVLTLIIPSVIFGVLAGRVRRPLGQAHRAHRHQPDPRQHRVRATRCSGCCPACR